MKRLFKTKADKPVRKPRQTARNIPSRTIRPAFDAVAYAAVLEVMG